MTQSTSTILVEVVHEPLQLARYTDFVQHNGAGAIATFTGVTRDHFQGKRVVKLEYEAYEPMAAKSMQELCKTAHKRWPLLAAAIGHRVGEVRVGEASVVIAISSAHRGEALEACAWAIDELKATVPIWKKEVYESGDAWKENAEARQAVSRAV